jgi:glycosyltransferase involved in cell wall biosynthesis
VNAKPRIQIFLQNLFDEKAVETARRMPYVKRDFKVGVTHLNSTTRSGSGAFQDSGIPLTPVEAPLLPPDDLLNLIEAFYASMKSDPPDIAMAALPGPEAAAFLIAARAAGAAQLIAEFDDQPALISCLEELTALHFCDLILPATRNLQRALTLALPHLADRAKNMLPHSADTTYIQLTKEDRRRLRQNLHVDPDSKLITMIAPFDQRRDHDTLIDACAVLKKRGYDFVLLLVGEGPERHRIAEKVYSLQMEERVTILDDPGDHLDILCATDIFALCTHFEGNNIPMLEAMAQGLAIAATDVPGINDLIRDQRSGRLGKPRDPESFAQALIDLLAQEKIRKKLGSVARKTVENRSNLNHFMPAFLKLVKTRFKELSAGAPRKADSPGKSRKKPVKDGQLGRQYIKMQKEIRALWTSAAPDFGIAQAADLLDGFPIHTQVDLLEKLCAVKLESGPPALFVRPVEKVLADRFYEKMPLLEMRLLEKLAAFYIELSYLEGVEKIREAMVQNAQKELFRYHFSRNRFAAIRAYARLSQLCAFTGQNDHRDFFRLEMWEFMRDREEAPEVYFHQQNAALLESLGEIKLAARELQKDALGTVEMLQSIPVARPASEVGEVTSLPAIKPRALKSLPRNVAQKETKTARKKRLQEVEA